MFKYAFLFIFPALLMSCATLLHYPTQDARVTADKITAGLDCASFQDDFWDALYSVAQEKSALPTWRNMRAGFQASGQLQTLSPDERKRLVEALTDLYRIVADEVPDKLSRRFHDSREIVGVLSRLELGDRRSAATAELQQQISRGFQKVFRAAIPLNRVAKYACDGRKPAAAAVPEGPLLSRWKNSKNPAVFGALKVMATVYQSCKAGSEPPVTSGVPDVQGISVIGMYDDRIGRKRVVSSVGDLLKTDYYLSSYKRPGPRCFDVTKSPLIYDYGGRPYVRASSSSFDLFTDNGGTPVLGVDCSGYIYTSLAAAGLKLKKSGRLKAINVSGILADMFFHPQENGLTCLDYASFDDNRSLKPGDIVASSGHVVMIDSVGKDPFGILKFKRPEDCVLSNLSPKHFDFSILQSSPFKGGLGVQRTRASDYFSVPGEEDLLNGLLDSAVKACLAHTKHIAIRTVATTASITRHAGTPDCMDHPIHLAHEECVYSCPAKRVVN